MKFTFSAIPAAHIGVSLGCALLSGCAAPTLPASPGHVQAPPPVAGRIPEPVLQQPPLPAPKPARKQETYSVTVHQVPAQSLLFALARDAGLNVDVHPGISGNVTLNALDQTLPQLLERIARQVDMRYEIDGATLTVLPDTPVWRNYKVDYVNMARSTNSSVNIATQISTTGAGGAASGQAGTTPGAGPAQSQGGMGGNNNSTTSVINRSDNNFWATLEKNIRDMLRESTLNDPATASVAAQPLPAQQLPPGAQQPNTAQGQQGQSQAIPENVLAAFNASSAAGERTLASVIVNQESGLLAVRATGRQHQKIAQFLDVVLGAAKRQVLIEATVIEVRLSDQYQQGINWNIVGSKFNFGQFLSGPAVSSGVNPGSSQGLFNLSYRNVKGPLDQITSAVQLLESFGKVRVLSSPKLSVMNNQTAMLKVVDNSVFFSIRVTPAVIGPTGVQTAPPTYESRLETVPVGFVMSVTPQIADNDDVTLNVRPTITRIVDYVDDPNPALAEARVTSRVPVIQAREIESVMKVRSGDISVLGGLMQDTVDNAKDALPLVNRLPLIGNLFAYRNEQVNKTELVIFIRPVVVKHASVEGDYGDYRYLLPDGRPVPAYGEDPAARVTP